MLRPKRLSGLKLTLEILINTVLENINLSLEKLSPDPEKILKTRYLSFKP